MSKSHNNVPYQLALCGRFVFGRRSTERKKDVGEVSQTDTSIQQTEQIHDKSGSLREDTCTGCSYTENGLPDMSRCKHVINEQF